MITPLFGLTATERVLPSLALDWTTGLPQDGVDVSRAGIATYIDNNGVLQDASADTQRIDYSTGVAGLLVEESRTNSLVNNTGNGAIVGAPGTLPTNWTISPSGLTREVVAVGNENGVEYVDVKISGTTTATNPTISFQSYSLITAAQNEQWAFSSWLKIVAGTTANIFGIVFLAQERTSTGTLTANLLSAILPISTALTRMSHVFTMTNASTQRLQPLLRFNVASGVAVDITLRIGLPQVEKGAFVTSVVKTSTTAVTRNADVATITGTNFSDWWNAGLGGILVKSLQNTVSGIRPTVQFDDTTADNFIVLRGNTTNPELYIKATTDQAQIDAGTIFANTAYRLAGSWATNSVAASVNSGTSVLDGSAIIPTVTQMRIGSDGTNYLNGTIQAIDYYDQALFPSKLQLLSATTGRKSVMNSIMGSVIKPIIRG